MAKNKSNLIGSWAFLIGVILAVVLGFMGSLSPTFVYVLVAIGILVGLLNIADAETQPFLMSGTVLIIAAALGQSVVSSIEQLSGILVALLAIFTPATIIVAIKNVFKLARN
ncbi:MAG: hypothetical protein Q7S33_04220 [Nanoarchaeota archaeon]|nr:hypothetical protein [Nanoarchaeota archaeon]